MFPSGGAPEPEPPSNQRYQPGAVVGGKYRLVRRLDEGGMGTVWVALNMDLDANVAIKLIRHDANAESTAERLLNEARVLARLDHPAIVRVHDFGRTDAGDPFIVMELLEGECLADLAYRQGRLTAVSGVQLLLPIAEALAVAHERGIVHRDLKPDNVFLACPGGGRIQPKVLDFGIAHGPMTGSMRLTRDGSVLGSPAYMSPEQARGQRDLGPATDVWSFCIVLYELLVGATPFEGDNYNSVLRAIIETEPDSITTMAAGDAALWRIIARGLAKERELRWPSMRALGAELAGWLMSHGVQEDVTRASLPATWFDSHGPEPDLFSVPPIALPRNSSAPPVPRAPIETMDSERVVLPAVTTGPPPPRLSTGGHGAVSLTAGSSRRNPRWWILAAGLATLVLGGGAALAWRAAGQAETRGADEAASSGPSLPLPPRVVRTRVPALPAPARQLAADAGAKREAGAQTRPAEPSVAPRADKRARPMEKPSWRHRDHVRVKPAEKSGTVGDLKVPY